MMITNNEAKGVKKAKAAKPQAEMSLSKQKGFWWACLIGALLSPVVSLLGMPYLLLSTAITVILVILTYTSYKSVIKDKAKGEYKTLIITTVACLGVFAGGFQLLLFNNRLGKDSFKWYFLSFIVLCIFWTLLSFII
jgi:uncharacterized membrane protein YfcA